MNGVFEQTLERDGRLVYKTRGNSMRPMLRPGRDIVIIEPVRGRLKRLDTALYRSGGKYVLHRVVRVKKNGYVCRGDNNAFTERGITDGDIVGVLTGLIRNGKQYGVSDRGYRFYAHVWCALYPLRFVLKKVKHLAGKIIKSLKRGGKKA